MSPPPFSPRTAAEEPRSGDIGDARHPKLQQPLPRTRPGTTGAAAMVAGKERESQSATRMGVRVRRFAVGDRDRGGEALGI
jgi:hypothetical protein